MKMRVAIIGNGLQVRKHHLPYLLTRADVELSWASGCACTPSERADCPLKKLGLVSDCTEGENLNDWKSLLQTDRPDAVIISTPNATHEAMIRSALAVDIHVAVDKPPTISPEACAELVRIADQKRRLFLTISQRRYEDAYLAMQKRLAADDLGNIRLINYFAAHSFGPQGWRREKRLAGGGILLDSAYHGIDTILWLLRHLPTGRKIYPIRLSADWILDSSQREPKERIELIGAIRIVMSNGCIFNIAASYENPTGSTDETIKIFGDRGALRYVRDELTKSPMSAGRLTFQRQTGESYEDHDGHSQGKRWAPLKDFFDVVAAGSGKVSSPAADSIPVLCILEAAYQSAVRGGVSVEINSMKTNTVLGIDHVAVQTSDIEAAIHFYVEVLGAELLERRAFKRRQMAWLKVGVTKIELFSKRTGENLEGWSDFYSGPVHIAFRVTDLDAFLSQALAKGAHFHPSHPAPFVPPVEGASKIAYLLGPDGEEVEIRDHCEV